MKENYSRRVWLNPNDSSSTGSIVVFDGDASWCTHQGDRGYALFVEIADCLGKVRLHKSHFDTREQFTDKVRILRDVLDDFLKHLNETHSDKVEVTGNI